MLTLLGIGFLIGITGSMHCIGMCGPLAILIGSDRFNSTLVDSILYHTGRITSYLLIGILVGLIGISIGFLRLEQYFSVLLGIILLLITTMGMKIGTIQSSFFVQRMNQINEFIRKMIANNLGFLPMYFKGMMNGFLPCGLVLVAISTSAGLSSLTDSLLMMLGFGIGTFPLMLFVSLSHQLINSRIRRIFSKMAPAVSIIMACLLILRGLNLGVPYLSPYINRFDLLQSVIHCH